MPEYRRYFVPGGTYFFTVVTFSRRPILTSPLARSCLREAMRDARKRRPFITVALALMPDHLHGVWTLPPDDSDYSSRWARIKESFTRAYLRSGGEEGNRRESRVRHRERSVWQRRFWEHTVRDEDDLRRCVDYIHWNPVKHSLVKAVREYPWSTFHRFVREGEYEVDWGGTNPCPEVEGPGWE